MYFGKKPAVWEQLEEVIRSFRSWYRNQSFCHDLLSVMGSFRQDLPHRMKLSLQLLQSRAFHNLCLGFVRSTSIASCVDTYFCTFVSCILLVAYGNCWPSAENANYLG
uniref:Uncharacterized protein n=1 Tax=Physcomitrium patens TaxID=3218 RepID=A0A2K1K9R4_PHYPA|nr:hypothetical protein PHYPA_009701 [Physcomitrium patens]